MLPGSLLHQSKRYDEYVPPEMLPFHLLPGDVVGCYIHLDEYVPMNNHIRYYKNGVDLGVAFTNNKANSFYSKCQVTPTNALEIPPAVYYPAVSLYQKVSHLQRILSQDCCARTWM